MATAALSLSPGLILLGAQFLLHAAGWVLCSLLLPDKRRAMLYWGGFMLFNGVGLVLTGLRGEPRSWWAYGGANVLILLSYVVLWRGVAAFLDHPARGREQALTLLPLALVVGVLGAVASQAALRVVLAYAGGAYILGRMLVDILPPLGRAVGRRLALVLALPALLMMLMMSLRALQQMGDLAQAMEIHQLEHERHWEYVGYLVSAALFSFSFMALLVSQLVSRLQQQVRLDPLTQLFNRRGIDEALPKLGGAPRAGADALPQRTTLAVLAVDLDHFKQVNDTHGHDVGDQVLVLVARRLRAALRPGDIAARTGGEEFIALLPDASAEQALAVAERLRRSVGDQALNVPSADGGISLGVTVSVGVALSDPEDPREAGHQTLLHRADQALYRAKASGRNRVCLQEGQRSGAPGQGRGVQAGPGQP